MSLQRTFHWPHSRNLGETFEGWLRGRADIGAALAGARRDGPWLASGPLAPGIRTGVADGVLRVGNAGAEAHPLLGEGMSMALQSAALLAARLLDPATGIDPRRGARDGAGDAAAASRLLEIQRAHHRAFRREFDAVCAEQKQASVREADDPPPIPVRG